ncbi:hypothetical protein BH09PSE5_BH09PSE5_02180 [soil metagenome]
MVRKSLSAGLKAGNKATKKAFAIGLERTVEHALKPALKAAGITKSAPPRGPGDWIRGVAVGAAGPRAFNLYNPPDIQRGERLPLLLMLHGCGQDANGFAVSTRMNRLAARERFLVLYPEQDRLANPQGCWNWFETRSGRAFAELSSVLAAVEQVCLFHPVDRDRLAVAGLSAGASMAALLASRHPTVFKAVAMHSGVAPGAAHSTLSAIEAMRGRRTSQAAHLSKLTEAVKAAGSGADVAHDDPRLESPPSPVAWPPLLVIQGRSDRVVEPGNGLAAASYWSAHTDSHAGEPTVLQRGRRHRASITEFKHARRTRVTLCEIDGLGHAWSGGSSAHPFGDTRGPDASRMIWSFVQRQFVAAAKLAGKR